jgi:hypothetical protein
VTSISENEDKYSAYIESHSIGSMTWSLFSGFTFAAITILLTQHPDSSQISAQITLFIFAFMLFLFLHNLNGSNVAIGICIRTAPPLPEKWQSKRFKSIQSLFDWIGWILLGYSVVFMYLLWNLYYLALASFVLGLLFLTLCYIDYIKPSKEYFRKHPWVRK